MDTVPSHVGIDGNEEADDFAVWGSHLDMISPLKIAFSDAQNEIRCSMIRNWNEYYQYSSQFKGRQHFKIQQNVNSKPWFHGTNLNGMEIKILMRLRTNHSLCGGKKKLFKFEESSLCEDCNVENDLEHILLKCRKYQDKRRNYAPLLQCNNITDLLREITVDKYRTITRFYRDAELDF